MHVLTLETTALVHDAGMRLLDYERLYRKKNLSPDELGILARRLGVAIDQLRRIAARYRI